MCVCICLVWVIVARVWNNKHYRWIARLISFAWAPPICAERGTIENIQNENICLCLGSNKWHPPPPAFQPDALNWLVTGTDLYFKTLSESCLMNRTWHWLWFTVLMQRFIKLKTSIWILRLHMYVFSGRKTNFFCIISILSRKKMKCLHFICRLSYTSIL